MFDGLNNSLNTASQTVLQKVMLIALSTPFTIYFLGFINFLDFSSLYILLNIRLP